MIEDIKQSLRETAKDRLDMDEDNVLAEAPKGEHERPLFYIAFKERKRSREGFAGMVLYDYVFDVGVEVLEDSGDADHKQKADYMEAAFVEGEELPFYHFEDGTRYARDGKIKVSRLTLIEGPKDRQRNLLKAEMTVTF